MWNEKTIGIERRGKVVIETVQESDGRFRTNYYIECKYRKNNKIRTRREPIQNLFSDFVDKRVEIDINLLR